MRSLLLLALLLTAPSHGDVHPGLENLATKAYSPSIMDPVIFSNMWRSWDRASRAVAEQASEAERRRLTLDRYGLLEAPYDNGGAPLGFVARDDGTWAMTCLICHAGAVDGQTILGLPNTALDFSAIYEDVEKTVTLLHGDRPGQPPYPEGLLTFASGDGSGTVVIPEGLLSVSRGTINSFTFSVYFLSHRNEDLSLRQEPLPFDMLNHYLDPPPLWHTAKRKAFYSDGFVEKSARALMQFSLDPSFAAERFKSWEEDYDEIYDWLHTLASPRYRGVIDEERAAYGRQLFSENCMKCHGTPGMGGEYKNEVVPIEEVRTDRSRLDGLSPEFRKHFRDSWMGGYGATGVVVDAKGYVPPPLDGVWASAPYFHNGSVPTVYHVLFPDERPAVWRVKDYASYDHQRVGLAIETYEEMPQTANLSEKRGFYDTNHRTMSNSGHPFADHLSREQKLSLLEYLKSL